MPAAGEFLRDLVNVDGASAAKRNLHLVVAQITEENREPGAANRPRMLSDPLEVLILETVLFGWSRRDGDPRDTVLGIDLQSGERVAEEVEPAHRHRRVKPAVHLLRLDTGGNQLSGNAETARRR